jgi:hypothetical protein
MQLTNAPAKLVEPFAVNAAPSGGFGGKRTVPVPSQIGVTPGAASLNDGFPPLTMTPISDGGVVMSGLDMNGALFQISAPAWWYNAGASFQYDSVYSAAVGGYPKGARLLNAAGTGFWISIVDNNVTDPDTGGAGWVPDRSGQSVSASVYASAQQTLASGGSKIIWNTVQWDPFGMWNSGSSAFVAPWAGKYRLSGSVYLPAAPAQLYATSIFQNGALTLNCGEYPQVSDQDMSYVFNGVLNCAVGDQITATLFLGSTSCLAGKASGSNQPYVYGQLEFLGA